MTKSGKQHGFCHAFAILTGTNVEKKNIPEASFQLVCVENKPIKSAALSELSRIQLSLPFFL